MTRQEFLVLLEEFASKYADLAVNAPDFHAPSNPVYDEVIHQEREKIMAALDALINTSKKHPL